MGGRLMLYAFTPEQDELRAVVRRCAADHGSPGIAYEDTEPTAVDAGLWKRLVDLGIPGLGVPEALGGSDGTLIDQVVVAEELGRAVAPVPFVGHTVAVDMLARTATEEQQQRWLPRLADGATIGGVVPAGPGVTPAPDIAAVDQGEGWRLSGHVPMVFDAGGAGLLVVPAHTDDGTRLFVVPEPTLTLRPSLDRTRPFGVLTLDGSPAEPIGTAEDAPVTMDRAVATLRTLLAAESAGLCAGLLDRTSAYTRERRQFGRPIGTFQAVKHRLADMLCDTENARSAAYAAAWTLAEGGVEWPRSVSMAQAVAGESAITAARAAIQLHGGIGVTWECGLHLHLRRAKLLELLYGAPSWHYQQIAVTLLDPS